jgi:hypothetical protein
MSSLARALNRPVYRPMLRVLSSCSTLTIPGDPIAYWKLPLLQDSIGLSVSELYPLLNPLLQSIVSSDGGATRLSDAQIVTNIESSVYLNSSLGLVGDASKGYALYVDGTAESVLDKAKRYLGCTYYGVSYDTTNSNPDVTRVGQNVAHRYLPIQSQMLTYLINDNGTVNYQLDPADWSKKLDGTASNRDGTDGQVMTYLPEYWFKVESVGNTKRWLLSAVALDGFTRNRPQYISAYEAALNRTTSKLASVANLSADYRGGNNNAAWDAESRTLLGKPATSITRTAFRTYARNRGTGWEMDNYLAQRTLLRFFLVEFATRNSQKAVNAALVDGLRQGGLGIGVTNINSTLWSTFNSYYPFIPCGQSDILGNATGDVAYAMPAEYGTLDTYVNRYRGIEMPLGHIWKNLDGVNLRIFADTEATPISAAFISDDPALWNDSNYVGLDNIGNISRSNGYVSGLLDGELLPVNISGGGSTTYWADYFYTSLPSSGESLRTVLLGGAANFGSNAGLGYSYSNGSPSSTSSTIGSRLCYIPSEAG